MRKIMESVVRAMGNNNDEGYYNSGKDGEGQNDNSDAGSGEGHDISQKS